MATACGDVQGFKVICFKFNEKSAALHQVFCKRHVVREASPEKPEDRTLFLVNVPPYCDEECLKGVFKTCGDVTSVFFHQKPTSSVPPSEESSFFFKHPVVKGFKVAYVVFKKAVGLKNALKLDSSKPLILSTKEHPISTGVEKWIQEYNNRIPKVAALQEDINVYMTHFDQEAKEKIRQEKEGNDDDDEGWTTVTKTGRMKSFPRKESVANKIMAKEQGKKSKKELLNFYTFQIRESKMKNLAHLRQKFEDDKKKINMLKKSRRFKPF